MTGSRYAADLPRSRPPGRALMLSGAVHALGLVGLLASGLGPDHAATALPVEVAVEAVPAPVDPLAARAAAAMREALAALDGGTDTTPADPTAEGTAWPSLPTRIRPPRLAAQVAEALRLPDAPPPLPPPEPIDLFGRDLPGGDLAPARSAAVGDQRPARELPGNAPPDYPPEARRKGLQGKVVVRVDLSPAGRPTAVLLVESSGWASLDDAALEAVRGWRFEPAIRDGRPVAARVDLPVVFSLAGG